MTTTPKGYTTATMVRNRAAKIPAVGTLTDDNINEFIVAAEGLIDAVTMTDWKNIFSITKHTLILGTATDIAALYAVGYDPSVYTDLAEAQSILDVLWANGIRGLNLLDDASVVKFLKGL